MCWREQEKQVQNKRFNSREWMNELTRGSRRWGVELNLSEQGECGDGPLQAMEDKSVSTTMQGWTRWSHRTVQPSTTNPTYWIKIKIQANSNFQTGGIALNCDLVERIEVKSIIAILIVALIAMNLTMKTKPLEQSAMLLLVIVCWDPKTKLANVFWCDGPRGHRGQCYNQTRLDIMDI